jgi:hypothetical protein
MQAIARRAAAPVFALALFCSAALIFVLQPLFGRMVTPLLGGSPAVWNASMAFFQAALLIGYLYAHVLARIKDLRVQAAIHALVLVAAFLVLPVRVSDMFGPPNSEHPALWLVGVLTLSVGAPFAAASATAPLLQAWYARTGRADAHDPYYLYAASNIGSFIGLLAYPVVIEPLLGVSAQGLAWTSGYILAAALIALSAATAIAANGGQSFGATSETSPSLTWRQRGYWMAAAAAPSALILGVTLHISTDVASAPMLWVVPLALYLATFVIAFARGSERFSQIVTFIHPVALALLVFSYFSGADWAMTLSGNLVGFFLSALVCHMALARTRPAADRLTEFYFWVSLGGVIGGGFAAFVAPVIFNDVYEYPLALAAAALFLPRGLTPKWRLANMAAAAATTMACVALLLMEFETQHAVIIAVAAGGAAILIAAGWGEDNRAQQLRVAFLVVAVIFAVMALYIAVDLAMGLHTVFVESIVNGKNEFQTLMPWYPILLAVSLIALAFALHAALQPQEKAIPVADIALGVAAPAMVLLMALVLMGEGLTAQTTIVIAMCFCGVALFFNGARPIVLAALVLVSFVTIFLDDRRGGRVITQERSFFGVLRTRVIDDPHDPEIPQLRILMHGTTIHGAQLATPGMTRLPLTYYNPRTALGEAIMAGLSTGDQSSLALIGLGAGSTACLMRPSDRLTIFEIDPTVVRLSARPGGDFTYVPECQPNARAELGDARLQIAQEPNGAFDVIVVDAFSSDAIPAHLLTREAIALYLSKTSERGIVILHLSNRNLALVSEAARVAHDLHAPALFRVSERVTEPHGSFYAGLPASAMIIAHSPETLAHLPLPSAWRELQAPPGRAWSDDYINLPRALWESLTGEEECLTYPNSEACGEETK